MDNVLKLIISTSVSYFEYLNNIKIFGSLSLLSIIFTFFVMIVVIKFITSISNK